MSEHYFSREPVSAEKPRLIEFSAGGVSLKLKSDGGVFSANKVDYGSELLICTALAVRDWKGVRVLDIGCGYGAVGLSLAKAGADVVMCDINERALRLCSENIQLNSLSATCLSADCGEGIEGVFGAVVTNPPIRAGKSTVFGFFDNAHRLLGENGELFVVIRKQQGAESAKKYISELFGSCEIIERSAGYWILRSVKR